MLEFGPVDEFLRETHCWTRDFIFRKTLSMLAMAVLSAKGVKMRVGIFARDWEGERGCADEWSSLVSAQQETYRQRTARVAIVMIVKMVLMAMPMSLGACMSAAARTSVLIAKVARPQ